MNQFLMLAAVLLPLSCAAGEPARPLEDFLNSIGVNSAIDSRFELKEQTAESLNYIGARWIRGGAQSSTDVFDYLIENVPHIRFTFMFSPSGKNGDEVFAQAAYLHERGRLIAMEGVNEPNNWGITWEGEPGGGHAGHSWLPIAKMQRDCYARTKAELGADVPVWSITETGAMRDNVGLQYATIPAGAGCLLPDGTRFYDVYNLHNYFIHPRWPAHSDNQTWRAAASDKEGLVVDGVYDNHGETWLKHFRGPSEEELRAAPKVTTETGCTLSSYKAWENGPEGPHSVWHAVEDPGSHVTEQEQGLYYMSCYLAQFARGFDYTAMYILRDRTDEPGNQSFGLVEPLAWEEYPLHGYRQRYRLAADYMHNLTTILADDGPRRRSGSLAYTLEGAGECVHDLLLRHSDGRYFLIVWGERFSGGSDDVTVRLGGKRKVRVYNPVEGTDPVAEPGKTASVSLKVSNHPYILEIK